MFESRNIYLRNLKDTKIANATYYGRIFAYSTGITEGMKELSNEKDFVFETADGCVEMYDKLKKFDDYNFLGGMACKGGCINGPAVLKQNKTNKKYIIHYAREAR
jgi:iron only hydrogenase large subunit-like protein